MEAFGGSYTEYPGIGLAADPPKKDKPIIECASAVEPLRCQLSCTAATGLSSLMKYWRVVSCARFLNPARSDD